MAVPDVCIKNLSLQYKTLQRSSLLWWSLYSFPRFLVYIGYLHLWVYSNTHLKLPWWPEGNYFISHPGPFCSRILWCQLEKICHMVIIVNKSNLAAGRKIVSQPETTVLLVGCSRFLWILRMVYIKWFPNYWSTLYPSLFIQAHHCLLMQMWTWPKQAFTSFYVASLIGITA